MIVKESPVDARDSSEVLLKALENAEFAHDLLIVYQLSVMLLEYSEPEPVIHASLDVLHERTKAAVVGFLWATDDGHLRPKMVLPDRGEDISLNETLSNVVSEQGRAVWISNHTDSSGENALRKYSDAICVPLIRNKVTVGVLHLYLKNGRFRRSDFDLAISVANLMVVALVRTRKDMSLKADHRRLANEVADTRSLLGDSAPMRELKSKIARIGPARGAVLIRGESGSGKELVARALHAASHRTDRPLLSVNCAAIPADLIESQLFGHRKGAFTGADRDHDGWFQQADTGTLFLDEIGELPLEGQAKLLRILEGHPFLPVGATEEVTVDVRVIAATNRDLKEFVRRRQFRQDLYFRLSVFELDVPPLRDRGDDVRLLVQHFFDHYRRQHGRAQLKLSDAALARLLEYEWPGNIRQLRNMMDSAVVLAEGNTIAAEDLGIQSIPMSDRPQSLKIAEWERRLIQDALTRTRGRVPDAAKLLGIGRATLYRKIDEYQIDR
jgi:Nif-specific regulatory protein